MADFLKVYFNIYHCLRGHHMLRKIIVLEDNFLCKGLPHFDFTSLSLFIYLSIYLSIDIYFMNR